MSADPTTPVAPLSRSEMLEMISLKPDASNADIFNKTVELLKHDLCDESTYFAVNRVLQRLRSLIEHCLLYCSLVEYTIEIIFLENLNPWMQKAKIATWHCFYSFGKLEEFELNPLVLTLKDVIFYTQYFHQEIIPYMDVLREKFLSEQLYEDMVKKFWPYKQILAPLSEEEMLAKINMKPGTSVLEIFNKFVKLFKRLDKDSRLEPNKPDNYVISLCLMYISLIRKSTEIETLEKNTPVIRKVKLHFCGVYPRLNRILKHTGIPGEYERLWVLMLSLLACHPCIFTCYTEVQRYLCEEFRATLQLMVNKRIRLLGEREALKEIYGYQLFTFGGIPPPLPREEILQVFELPPTATAKEVLSRFVVVMESELHINGLVSHSLSHEESTVDEQFLLYCTAYVSLISYEDGSVEVDEARNATLLEFKRAICQLGSFSFDLPLRHVNMKMVVEALYGKLTMTSIWVLQHMSEDVRSNVMVMKKMHVVIRELDELMIDGEEPRERQSGRGDRETHLNREMRLNGGIKRKTKIGEQNSDKGCESQGFQKVDPIPKEHEEKEKHLKNKGKKRRGRKTMRETKGKETTTKTENAPRKGASPLIESENQKQTKEEKDEDDQAWREKHKAMKKKEQERQDKERKRLEKLRQELREQPIFVPNMGACRSKEVQSKKHNSSRHKRDKKKPREKEGNERPTVISTIDDDRQNKVQLASDTKIGTRLSDLKFDIFNPPQKADQPKKQQFEGHTVSDTRDLKMAPYVLRRKGCDEVEAFSNIEVPPLAPPPERNVWEERLKQQKEKRPTSAEEIEEMRRVAMEMTAMNIATRDRREDEFPDDYAFPVLPQMFESNNQAISSYHGDDLDDSIFQSDDEDIEKSVANAASNKKKLTSAEPRDSAPAMSFADQFYDNESESDSETETETSENDNEEPPAAISTQWHRSDLSQSSFLSIIHNLGQSSQKPKQEDMQQFAPQRLLENDNNETLTLFQ